MATQQKHQPHPANEAAQKQPKVNPARVQPDSAALTELSSPLALQRAIADPRAASPRDILALQRLAGNRAVTRLIQAKLTVGPAGDCYEQEADRVADQVMNMQLPSPLSTTTVPLTCHSERNEVERRIPEIAALQQPAALGILRRSPAPPQVRVAPQNDMYGCSVKRKYFAKQVGGGGELLNGFDAGPDVESRLAASRGTGSPLPDDVRATMEPRFGADFGGVRVHTGGEADHLNRQLSAQAFTHGHDIYMAAGKYAPGTSAGNRLLAHELTHVIQQGSATRRAGGSMLSGSPRGTGQIQAKPADIQRVAGEVTGIDWDTAEKVEPSEGGAMGGVMRVTIGPAVHILKAVNSGAGAKFGESILKHVGGAVTTESQLVPNTGAGEGRSVMGMLARFKEEGTNPYLKQHPEYKGTWAKHQPRWERNYPFFASARYLALQKNMVAAGGAEMEDIWNDPARAKALINATLLYNLGRAMAADTLIGNADRFEGMNVGNAFIMARQQIGAIDTSTILQNYEEYLRQAQGNPFLETDKAAIARKGAAAAWVEFITKSGLELGGFAPSSSLATMLTGPGFDEWFENSFRNPLYAKITGKHEKDMPGPVAQHWLAAKEHIRRGFEHGMRLIDQLLTGQKYKGLKTGFKAQETAYGPDVNFDWRAFKARRAYIITLRSGGTPAAAQQNATALAKYMFEWKPQVRSLGQFDPGLAVVPDRPAAPKLGERFERAFSFRTEEEKEAGQLKKQVRHGQLNQELLARIQAASGGRRKDKALFETQYALFLASMRQRAEGLGDLANECGTARGLAAGNGPQAELAQKKLHFVATLRGLFASMEASYTGTAVQWINKLNSKTKRDVSYRKDLTIARAELQNKNAPFR